jgi:hypothetical protein
MPPVLFTLVIFEIGSHFLLRLTWTMTLLSYTFHYNWDDRHAPPYSAIGREEGLTKFLSGLASNYSSPDLHLLVVRITGVSC